MNSSILIPARSEYTRPCLEYAEALALASGFVVEEAAQIRLAIEEALDFGIRHFFDGASEADTRFEVRFEISSSAFHCIILDKGLPFDINAFPGYATARDPEQLETVGLGIFLIRHLMDEMALVNRGRDGKEWHLIKKKAGAHVSRMIEDGDGGSESASPVISGPVNLQIRLFEPGDALEVARLAYRTYGYGYEDFIYYPQELIHMNQAGILQSFVAAGENGAIAGHVGIYYFKESPGLVEWRAGFVNPAYRQHRVFHRILLRMTEEAAKPGSLGAFGRAVGGHLVSQKELIKYGLKSCGILLAAFPADVEFKALTGLIPTRFHAVMQYRQFHAGHLPRLYVPPRHEAMIGAIYRHIGREFEFGEAAVQENPGSSATGMIAHREAVLNTVDIKVWEYGPNVVDELKSQWHLARLEHNDVIYLYLNLEDPFAPRLISLFEDMGFFFAGILPDGLYGHDALILQYLNNLDVDYASISVFCPFAREILDYVREENQLALSINR